MEVAEHLSEILMESDSQSQVQSELRGMKEAWERSTQQLRTNKDLVDTTVQVTRLSLIYVCPFTEVTSLKYCEQAA